MFNKKYFLIILTLTIFICGIQTIDSASAAKTKLIDKGSKNVTDKDFGNGTFHWKTYKKGKNYVKFISYIYYPKIKQKINIYLYFKKVKKSKMKITTITKGFGKKYKRSYYEKIKISAVSFYWTGRAYWVNPKSWM